MSKGKDARLKIGPGLHPESRQLGTVQAPFQRITPFPLWGYFQSAPHTFIFSTHCRMKRILSPEAGVGGGGYFFYKNVKSVRVAQMILFHPLMVTKDNFWNSSKVIP